MRLLAFVLDTVSRVARLIAATVTMLTLLGLALVALGRGELGGYGVGDLLITWLACTGVLVATTVVARAAATWLGGR
jgi:uncharacterized membrane protein